MTILYVNKPGAVVRRDVESIKVTHREPQQRKQKTLDAIAVRELEQVVLYGNVQLTTPAGALLLEHDIDVVFLSRYGKYRGRLSRGGSKFARLRHAQMQLAGDNRRSLALATEIVSAKLANQRNLMNRLGAEFGPKHRREFSGAATRINQMQSACRRARSLDALRGYEGKAGADYFAAIRKILDRRWGFSGRAYHPPPDPFNALLSFGYSLLLKDITATINIVGLDPFFGCFHALEYGRPSLTLDLMEEFRPIAVDEPMLRAVLNQRITPSDFVYTGQAKRPVEINDRKITEVISLYEEQLAQPVVHGHSNTRQTLRRCFELQARIYARVVMGTRQRYEGLIV